MTCKCGATTHRILPQHPNSLLIHDDDPIQEDHTVEEKVCLKCGWDIFIAHTDGGEECQNCGSEEWDNKI